MGGRSSSDRGRPSVIAVRSSGRENVAQSESNSLAEAAQAIQKEVESENKDPEFYFDGLERIQEEDRNNDSDDLRSESQSEARSFRSSIAASFAASTKRLDDWNKSRKEFMEDNPRSAEVFHQACWYLLVFYLTHVWSTTNRIIQQRNNGTTYFGIILIHSWFDPLQGFLNFVVYQRPRYIKERKKYPSLPRWRIMWRIIRPSLCGPPPDPNLSTQSSSQRGFSSQLFSGADASDDNFQVRPIRSNPNSRYSTNERFSVTEPVIIEVDDESSEDDDSSRREEPEASSNSRGKIEEADVMEDTDSSPTLEEEGSDVADTSEPKSVIQHEIRATDDRDEALLNEKEVLPIEVEEKKDEGQEHEDVLKSTAGEGEKEMETDLHRSSEDEVEEQTILFSEEIPQAKDSSIDEILDPVHQC